MTRFKLPENKRSPCPEFKASYIISDFRRSKQFFVQVPETNPTAPQIALSWGFGNLPERAAAGMDQACFIYPAMKY
jgi:hypothetical protein